MAANGHAESDTATFVPPPAFATLVNGETIKIPKLSLKDDIKLLGALSPVIQELVQSGIFSRGADGTTTITDEAAGVALSSILLKTAPETILVAASTILKKPEEWCGENLDFEAALEVVLPFLQQRLRRIMEKIGQLSGATLSLPSTGSPPS